TDHAMTGEGITTFFREFKPGTFDAMFEGLAPLRWCLFAESKNIYSGQKVKIEAVLANEDILIAGVYPALIQIIGPDNTKIFEKRYNVTIPKSEAGSEAPLAIPVCEEDLIIEGVAGQYRVLATLEKGGAPACGEV